MREGDVIDEYAFRCLESDWGRGLNWELTGGGERNRRTELRTELQTDRQTDR